jgi:putative YjhG/YagF family dehydratase
MLAMKHPIMADLFGENDDIAVTALYGHGPDGKLPLSEKSLLEEPSGNIFGMTQDAGMGWNPDLTGQDAYLIISTLGGLRSPTGEPLALGYHTGHWELDQQVRAAAEVFRENKVTPYSAYCSDPCDGRSQGTAGMMDSLPYRNDAAIVVRRLIRSLPKRVGVLALATCDKGLPAMLLGLAGCRDLPGIIVPGGVTLPTKDAEDTAIIQSLGARYSHGMISLEYAAEMGCKACGSPGGGCHFLGTAATTQVVSEALGLSLVHTALAPSGERVWLEAARRSALALLNLSRLDTSVKDILTEEAIENAMFVHAAVGGSTNLLLHLPAIAHSAGLPIPNVEDWSRVNRSTPRLVDALPNGPRNHPTVQVYMAGGVPEVLLHLKRMSLLNLDVRTAHGCDLGQVLDWWEQSERRSTAKKTLKDSTGVSADRVIMSPDQAKREGLTRTLVFPGGNLAPEGSVVKATSVDPTLLDDDQVYRHRGPARVFTTEKEAIESIKGLSERQLKPGDVLVLIGIGPLGTGMEEIYQVTSALKYIPWGKDVPVLTDGRFSGVSTGPCIGHVGPEGLAGGPIGRLRDNDEIEIVVDQKTLTGQVNLIGVNNQRPSSIDLQNILASRPRHPQLKPHPDLPSDTKLWGLLQSLSGGIWRGCVYDVDRIIEHLKSSSESLEHPSSLPSTICDYLARE